MLFLLLFTGLAYSQPQVPRISLHFSDVPVKEAFLEIEKQSGYTISYPTQGFNASRKVSVQEDDVSIHTVMEKMLSNTGFTFLIKNKTILIRKKEAGGSSGSNGITRMGVLAGNVTDDKGNPLASATVRIIELKKVIRTSDDGSFMVNLPSGAYSLDISFISYEGMRMQEVVIHPSKTTTIVPRLIPANGQLTDVVVTALGISKDKRQLGYAAQEIKGEDINTARTTNMFEGLQGRVAGLNMTQTSSGLTKTARIVLRGESSLNINKNQALIVVDGVPINNVGG